jgi:hypothetical protein
MTMIVDPHEIQRLRYTPGQDLLARDFRDQAAFEEQLRWWHNRAMHGAFGIRYGLAVQAAGAELTVGPGLAYDALGRELVLPATRTLHLPSGAREPAVLVIQYRQYREEGGADLAWIPARRLRSTDGVPLARVTVDDGQASPDPKFHPPIARPIARPRLGHGSTVAGGTAWQVWNLGSPNSLILGLQVWIDTRAAGFTQPPCYFAWLQGGVETKLGNAGASFLLPFFPHVAQPGLTGFRFRVLTVAIGSLEQLAANRAAILARAKLQLSVCWLGIQMQNDQGMLPEVIHEHP